MPTDQEMDLHGIEKQPFPSFDESTTYLERVTVPTAAEAKRLIAGVYRRNEDEVEVAPIHMHWLESEDDLLFGSGAPSFEGPGWYECAGVDDGALPFWREVV